MLGAIPGTPSFANALAPFMTRGRRGAWPIRAVGVGHRHNVGLDDRLKSLLERIGAHLGQHRARVAAAAVGGRKDRNLLARQAAAGRLATAATRLAARFPLTLATVQNERLVRLDNPPQLMRRLLYRPQKPAAPTKRRRCRNARTYDSLIAPVVLLPLPPCSPESNPMETAGQFLRGNRRSNRVFDSVAAARAARRDAWE